MRAQHWAEAEMISSFTRLKFTDDNVQRFLVLRLSLSFEAAPVLYDKCSLHGQTVADHNHPSCWRKSVKLLPGIQWRGLLCKAALLIRNDPQWSQRNIPSETESSPQLIWAHFNTSGLVHVTQILFSNGCTITEKQLSVKGRLGFAWSKLLSNVRLFWLIQDFLFRSEVVAFRIVLEASKCAAPHVYRCEAYEIPTHNWHSSAYPLHSA